MLLDIRCLFCCGSDGHYAGVAIFTLLVREKLFHEYCSVIEDCLSTQERHVNILTTLSCTGSYFMHVNFF